MAKFVHFQPDGDKVGPEGKAAVLRAAAARLIVGTGPFTVIRNGEYKHPGLRRLEALRVLNGILGSIGVDADVVVRNDKGVVFRATRVKPEPLYDDPFRHAAGVHGLRQDQGVDYSVSQRSPVYAVGPGKVTVYRETSGWPWDSTHADGGAYIAYEITEGPAKGLFVYDAEHIVLNEHLKVGSRVNKDTVIAYHLTGFANCEMGWAGSASHYGYGPGDAPEAVNEYNEGERTRAGDNFDLFLRALGTVAGLTEGRGISGTLPKKYPRSWKDRV